MDVAGAAELGRKYGVAHATSVDEVLARDDVDAVYVATPVDLHAPQSVGAARAGKHVFCEKPLARTVDEAMHVGAACQAAGVLLGEGYMMRHHGAHALIAQRIRDGAIGTPVYARAQLSCWYPPINGAWRQDPHRGGGGSLMDMATHLFDLLGLFLGPVARVCALTGRLVHGYPVEDAATVLLEFASGAHATVDAFFCIPDDAVPTRLEVYGSRGAVRTEGTIGQGAGGAAEICTEGSAAGYDATQERGGGGYRPLSFDEVNPYAAEFDAFAARIASGQHMTHAALESLLRPLAIAQAAYESASTGRFADVRVELGAGVA
jgi:predicted dehydrogenase